MTANLLGDRCDLVSIAALLETVSPDVVVTQELAPEPARLLTGMYPSHRLRPSLDFAGRGMATRLAVEFEDDIVMPGRDGTAAVLHLPEGRLRLAGIHLLNPISFPWWVSVRGRRNQLAGLFDWLDEDDRPLVVAGDFNASPRWPAYREVSSRLTDLVAEHARSTGGQPERTWAWRPGWPRLLRIDHVFGAGVRADAVEVRPIKGSDHHALITDLRIDAQSPTPKSTE